MNLGSILKPEAVRVLGSVTSKKRLMRDLSDAAAACYDIDPDKAMTALQDRESIGPTGVGNGVALPHARMPGLDRVAGVFVKLERPVSFDAVDRVPVDLVFALFAPEDSGVHHLKALAAVARVLRQNKVRVKLRANDDPMTLHAILVGAQESEAA
jgi:PTS system nitrogen regulatory IIA component